MKTSFWKNYLGDFLIMFIAQLLRDYVENPADLNNVAEFFATAAIVAAIVPFFMYFIIYVLKHLNALIEEVKWLNQRSDSPNTVSKDPNPQPEYFDYLAIFLGIVAILFLVYFLATHFYMTFVFVGQTVVAIRYLNSRNSN